MLNPADQPCLTAHPGGCLLRVVVTPNAPRTAADGLHDGCLRVRLNAPPVDGKANAALQAWLANELGLPKRGVELLHGQTSRRKRWAINTPLADVQAWLARQLGEADAADAHLGGKRPAGGTGRPRKPAAGAA